MPPIYKALAQHYRNRMRFAFVQVESVTGLEFGKEMGVDNWPTLLIELPDGTKEILKEKKLKIEAMRQFVDPYALPVGEEREERLIKSKRHTSELNDKESGYTVLRHSQDVEDQILAS